ncbi:MAG TPA: hypothetical protein DEA96_06820, partial [Leptospiraceae bacterium]|nr:hypothetical protein [Leptospiraceae bacterium]
REKAGFQCWILAARSPEISTETSAQTITLISTLIFPLVFPESSLNFSWILDPSMAFAPAVPGGFWPDSSRLQFKMDANLSFTGKLRIYLLVLCGCKQIFN